MEVQLETIGPSSDRTRQAELLAFLEHKGSPWIEDIRRRVTGHLKDSGDHFLVLRHDDRLVAHAWCCASPRAPEIGLLGHVYTEPDYRKQGFARRLLASLLKDFGARGGRVMQLFTSTPYTLDFYRELGFLERFDAPVDHERDWYMRSGSHADEQWLTESWSSLEHATSPLMASDLPLFSLLYNVDHSMRLKDWSQRIGTGLEAERAFIETWERVQAGTMACAVLRRGPLIAGIASVARGSFAHQSHVARFDCYAQHGSTADLPTLTEHVLESAIGWGVETLVALAVDRAKQEILETLGFRPVASISDVYRLDGEIFDGTYFIRSYSG